MENQETKLCKHCQSEMPKKAKVCPTCRRKQGGKLKWVIIAIVAMVIIGSVAGGGEGEKVKKTGEVANEEKESNQNDKTENNNIFNPGDIVETKDMKITFSSTGKYTEDNEFLQPKDGYEYWRFEFVFENISDSDQYVSSIMDWECYADNVKVDQAYVGDDNGLDATLSPGRTAQGSVCFEVPTGAENIELEYSINFWEEDKIVFVGK